MLGCAQGIAEWGFTLLWIADALFSRFEPDVNRRLITLEFLGDFQFLSIHSKYNL
jgi:hypothetical protein